MKPTYHITQRNGSLDYALCQNAETGTRFPFRWRPTGAMPEDCSHIVQFDDIAAANALIKAGAISGAEVVSSDQVVNKAAYPNGRWT